MARITQEVINVFRSKFNMYGTITAILGPLRLTHIIAVIFFSMIPRHYYEEKLLTSYKSWSLRLCVLEEWFAAINLIPKGDETSRIDLSLTRNAQEQVGSKAHALKEITID